MSTFWNNNNRKIRKIEKRSDVGPKGINAKGHILINVSKHLTKDANMTTTI